MDKKNPTQDCIHEVMHRFKIGKLMMGKSGQPVATRNQAIAIALSMCGKKTAVKKSADGCAPCAAMKALLEAELSVLEAEIALASMKANPYHDPKDGKFSTRAGGAAYGWLSPAQRAQRLKKKDNESNFDPRTAAGLPIRDWYQWDQNRSGRTRIAFDERGYALALTDDAQNKVLATAIARRVGGKAGLTATYIISSSEALEQRKGYGTEMYLDFLRYVYPMGITKEFETTAAADALHNSLRRRSDTNYDPKTGILTYKPQ